MVATTLSRRKGGASILKKLWEADLSSLSYPVYLEGGEGPTLVLWTKNPESAVEGVSNVRVDSFYIFLFLSIGAFIRTLILSLINKSITITISISIIVTVTLAVALIVGFVSHYK